MMKITVVGAGYVGCVTATCFADLGNQVINVDCDKAKIALLKKGKCHFYEPGLEELLVKNIKAKRLKFTTDLKASARASDIVFIAVGTPPKDNGDADLTQIEEVARTIAKTISRYKLIIEKSTVPVQTGDRVRETIRDNTSPKTPFDMASNPEFLREGTAIHDFMHPERVILGVESKKARTLLKELYKGIKAPLIFTDLKSAEIIKHASNSFLAMKISFINAISRICELSGADVEEVAQGMGLDSRIGKSFLRAGIGFGGFCFPKDLAAFIRISEKLGYDFQLLRVVEDINRAQIQGFVKKVEDHLWNLNGKTVSVWGLSFKANTDDMRYAPSIEIIQRLADQGAKIRAYDPKAMPKARKAIPGVRLGKNPYEICRGSDCLLILTEWNEFKEIDLSKIKRLMRGKLVVDGRNLYDPQAMRKIGFKYVSVGRK